jgi:hypothetical protein
VHTGGVRLKFHNAVTYSEFLLYCLPQKMHGIGDGFAAAPGFSGPQDLTHSIGDCPTQSTEVEVCKLYIQQQQHRPGISTSFSV